MFKSTLFIATLFTAHMAQAALQVNCDVWGNNDSDPTLDVSMVLPFTLGHKFDSMPTSPSVLTVIEKNYDGKTTKQSIIFNDEISHLNEKSSDGIFEVVTKNTYPIRKGTDILNPTPVPEKMRRLKLDLELLNKDKHSGERIDLSSLSFDVDQTLPGDSTLTGEGSISYNGKSYEKLSYRCNVYVTLRVVEQLLAKNKK
ncbi:hypothetical protein [Bdellovibrio bacteriovorus]|uniref:hypothetical protein n=1 Tax=Bdellovibrio TaxID=958 RepID=UPI0035A9A269